MSPLGADPGPFMLGRPGLYFREQNTIIVFLSFRGNDPHSGTSPTVHKKQLELDLKSQEFLKDINERWPNAGYVNRVGYVIYHSSQATTRDSAMSLTPETRFGNHGTLGASLNRSLNFKEHGSHILGSRKDSAIRFARELLSGFYNTLIVSGLTLKIPLKTIAQAIQSASLDVEPLEASECLPLDASDPDVHKFMELSRAHYGYYYDLCKSIALTLKKADFQREPSRESKSKSVTKIPSKLRPATLPPRGMQTKQVLPNSTSNSATTSLVPTLTTEPIEPTMHRKRPLSARLSLLVNRKLESTHSGTEGASKKRKRGTSNEKGAPKRPKFSHKAQPSNDISAGGVLEGRTEENSREGGNVMENPVSSAGNVKNRKEADEEDPEEYDHEEDVGEGDGEEDMEEDDHEKDMEEGDYEEDVEDDDESNIDGDETKKDFEVEKIAGHVSLRMFAGNQ